MVSITLSVPEDVKQRMEQFSEINWSGFIRKAIIQKTTALSWKEVMLKKIKEEEPILDWAVELLRPARKDRLQFLKKKGLI